MGGPFLPASWPQNIATVVPKLLAIVRLGVPVLQFCPLPVPDIIPSSITDIITSVILFSIRLQVPVYFVVVYLLKSSIAIFSQSSQLYFQLTFQLQAGVPQLFV